MKHLTMVVFALVLIAGIINSKEPERTGGSPLTDKIAVQVKPGPDSPITGYLTPHASKRSLIRIDARAGWLDTGIDVSPAQVLAVTYVSGTWSVDGRSFPGVNANGHINENTLSLRNWYRYKFLPAAPFGALIGAINDKTRPFLIGKAYRSKPPIKGRLFLRINDKDEALADNAGSINVSVETSR